MFEKPETQVLSCCHDSKIVTRNKEEKPKSTRDRKVCINSNNNLVIKADKQKENQSNKKFVYISFIDDLKGFN